MEEGPLLLLLLEILRDGEALLLVYVSSYFARGCLLCFARGVFLIVCPFSGQFSGCLGPLRHTIYPHRSKINHKQTQATQQGFVNDRVAK